MSAEEGTGGVEAAASPKPMLAGTFAIYEDAEGGMALVADTEQYGTVRRRISPMMVKFARGRIGQMFGGGTDGMDEHTTG